MLEEPISIGTQPIFDLLKFLGNAAGFFIANAAGTNYKSRLPGYRRVRDIYTSTAGFSRFWFWLFIFLLLIALIVIGLLVAVVAVLIIVLGISPRAISWMQSLPGGSWLIERLPIIGWLGVALSIAAGALVPYEPQISLRFLRHWLSGKQSERILAYRIKMGMPGVFKIDEENCEKLAQGIADGLEVSPDWLSGALLQDRPHDKTTLANELFIGTLFEALMYEPFGGDWKEFQPVQEKEFEGSALCSPVNIRQLSPSDFVTKMDEVFTNRGTPLTTNLKKALRENIALLRDTYGGMVSRILQFEAPKLAMLAVAFLITSVVLSLIMVPGSTGSISEFLGLHTSTALFLRTVRVISVVGLATLFFIQRGHWTEWLRLKVRLINKFEMVQERLERFDVFRDRPLARMALAKFSYEYGLLAIDPKELMLGRASQINLVLLKTRALWTDAAEPPASLPASDEDLRYFADATIRRIANYLESILVDKMTKGSNALAALGLKSPADLIGLYYPYNIVDGFLYLVGDQYCSRDACGDLTDTDCPFLKRKVCDSIKGDRFAYDREPRLFKKSSAPKG